MFTIYKKSIEWGGKQLTIETGKMARQADGAVVVTYGETVVLGTVVFAKEPKAGVDFFPLTCNYQEKFYAGGRIPGGFKKREGQPGERETLVSRLIDRPIRPLFAKGFKNDTQVVTQVLQYDRENEADIPAMIAASAALAISGAPFLGPIGAARVGFIDGTLVLNPTVSEQANSDLDLVVAGTTEGVLMVESEAKELPEDVMLEAVMFGHERFQKVIKAISELAEAAAKPTFVMPEAEDTSALEAKLEKAFGDDIVAAYKISDKQSRVKALDAVKKAAVLAEAGEEGTDSFDAAKADKVAKLVKNMQADVLRRDVLKKEIRIDGRKPTDVRPIVCEVDVLPRTHGSALFTRGETQALVVVTLGTGQDEQIIDVMEGESRERFLLHYNFPPFSVGETGRMGAPGRREIGHGKLGWRSINPLLPTAQEFPYTLRIVSEILESNGSSSMATVCGTSMALMAAGCPLPRPIAGIAMGLVKEGKDYVVLSDIMGDEDHLGDMDFKVAGSEEGITALQMDIKITSITREIMEQALEQARGGRLHILGKMAKAITEARTDISDYAPAMETIQIEKDNIRVLIGKGGETIRGLCEQYNCTIDIDDDGKVVVASVSRDNMKACIAHIDNMFAKPELGATYAGTVLNTTDFGAFVSFMGGKEGLVHVSEVVPVRLGHITDVLESGMGVTVKVIDLDDRGKIRLTVKDIPQEGIVAERIAAVVEAGGTQKRERTEGEDDNRGNRREGGRDRDRGGRGGDRGGNRGGDRNGGGDRGERRPRRQD
ncbi:MAG: polyribonucleotide nucleotidyltransferase [Blastochloris viridis]|uniref:Polyribonucleotide nucleotidyltransferase n=1 Tax=Blastochloris viridis TaxID=1079 RepID=A0A6N4RD89_BLAVI|nr:MAG: polyribonucleotide nucleotidyltransferase [Blastochloris viridis]